MNNKDLKWEIVGNFKSKASKVSAQEVIEILLENRGIKTKKEKRDFFKPVIPTKLKLVDVGIDKVSLQKSLERIKDFIQKDEEIIIYGDYDADGICATAILWEVLYSLTKKVRPYIPNRFEEGYGLNPETISKLKLENPSLGLIITVDNGIVAYGAVDKANSLGIDVIITDHHQKGDRLPKAYSIIHTDKISGSGIAWFFAREITKLGARYQPTTSLELVAIGTIADQLPLIGPNRSFAKYGLEELNRTKRPGLIALFEEASIKPGNLGSYEVNFIIAPRINAMGRMEHAIDSLRLLCTRNLSKAKEIAFLLGKTNRKRQEVVDEVILHARELVLKKKWKGPIVLAHESYHEGVIGLAAAKLVEEFYRPAIVLSRGEKVSKASARSISGFNIIESIRKLDDIILGGGGHPMAAGFSIETDKIEIFQQKFEEIATPLLTDEILTKKIKIDCNLEFDNLTLELTEKLIEFEPTGIGNPQPTFSTCDVNIVDAQTVGQDGKHLRLTLEKNDKVFIAIAFGKGDFFSQLSPDGKIDLAYNLILDEWNGNKNLQLRIKDMKIKST